MSKSVNIIANNVGKKFGKEWIFRHVDLHIQQGDKLAILGLNGSGKSTLLQALTGYLDINEGSIEYQVNNQTIEGDKPYRFISLASPYLELIEDFTFEEQLKHVENFKAFLPNLNIQSIIELSGLKAHQHKYIKQFSSGMRQRLKLVLAILADAPVLFLDEPTTNLDAKVIEWYKEMIQQYAFHKTIIVCSNSIKDEYHFCDKVIQIESYKVKT